MRDTFFKYFLTLSFCTLVFTGCIKSCSKIQDIPPEEQLYKYISTAVNVTKLDQRQDLIDLTTGTLKSALVNATDDSFKKAYLDRRYDFKAFEILERKDVQIGKEVNIEFKLIYKSWLPGEYPEKLPVTEIINRATLVYEYGRWAIAKVASLNTHFEWQEGLPTNVSTAGINDATAPAEVISNRSETNELPSTKPASSEK